MRSLLWSLALGLGTLGLTLGGTSTAQAQPYHGSAYTGQTVPVRYHWRGGWHGRAYYPSYGYYRGYRPYSWYGGYGTYYYPRAYQGYSPWGGYYGPYSSYYYRPGYRW